ncbi:MAG: Rne/Rng family ribonuclease [Acidobacteria bacterium]|nr:Rne/Rng family ribonuclease [Acidobacteriota bacterium]
MPKELIVSLNGREKKIAIIEDGRVTEFYIERGEASQGIVGNIYKGRVMRVLPGMQSAFVDIGLERDAFLYVSDFFDEEEEFERIVVDKKKTEGADAETAARAASERIERARIERERAMETAQEQAEPGVETEAQAGSAEDEEPAEAQAVVARQSEDTRTPEQPEVAAKDGGRQRGRRDRRDKGEGRGQATTAPAKADAQKSDAFSTEEDISTPFVSGADSFQRVVDEDEAAAEEGAMFKDARIQERLTDQTRAVEFDMDTTTTAEVGSLLGAGASADTSFERVDDDGDTAPPKSTRRGRSTKTQQVAASVGQLDEELTNTDAFSAGAQSFERVSDDEKAAETSTSSRSTTAASKSRASKKGAASTTAGKRGSKKAAGGEGEKAASKRPSRSRAAKGASKKSAAKDAGKTPGKGRSRSGKSAEAGDGESAPLADAKASVTTRTPRGEFARRGGRRRRKPGTGTEGTNGDEGRANGQSEDAEIVLDAPETPVETAPAPPAPPTPQPAARERTSRSGEGSRGGNAPRGGDRPRSSSSSGGGGPRGGGDGARGGEGSRGGDGPRSSSGSGGGDGRNTRDSRGGGGGRGRHQPLIADLLREGQEIIVQIAKEPISAKGARITSHIALPGRFLVYMPTVEHVGVSRKIESDSERVRLRKLIAAIVKEEDVPSGGFIVRTAGVGISEQDLRDDARYLVRTWRDIRRTAEKQKAPAMAHKDLDLVQRILRDQLSDDFAAIRVDSEEEYLAIVEFINRIQPRLVNRVKLHTRAEPILETYGVQPEIDKAIKPRVWLKSGGYLVINQTEALVAIDVNTGKFVGRGGNRLEDTITRTNMEAVDEIARQIRLRDLGGILVLDLIDMDDRRNRQKVMNALQDALRDDKSPTKVLSFNDFGLVIMTRKRVKQSLERTLCSPCPYCIGAGLVKSPQTVCYEMLEEARRLSRDNDGPIKQTTLRVNPEVARALRTTERDVLAEIEDYLGTVDVTSDEHVHQEQFDFALI